MILRTLIFLFAALSIGVTAEYAPARAEWNQPVEPFCVVGNVYYVGASSVSSFLVTTEEGHILLDTGFAETVPLVEASVKKLGFKMEDIKLLLASHAHYDHAGGVAIVKQRTGARFQVNPAEAPMFERGGKKDFAFGDQYAFPPVTPDGVLRDGEEVRLGDSTVTAHFTPGHTKGCTSYSFKVRENDQDYDVVFGCSTTAPDYRLIANKAYPEIIDDFKKTFAKLRSLPCDVFLGGHSWEFGLSEKLSALRAGATQNPFIDPGTLPEMLDRRQAAFRKQLTEQSAIVAKGAELALLADGFSFTEGPAADAEGNVYFTDQPNNKILKWSVDGTLSMFHKSPGRANGLYFDRAGDLYACADLNNELWKIDPAGKVTVLVTGYEGRKLNGPNDLWIDPKGGVYFTDPFYKRDYWDRGPIEQDGMHVYYLSPDRKKLRRVITDLVTPNGIIGTPDGKRLFVADIKDRKTYVYEINPDATLRNRRLFAEPGSDGMTLDNQGNLYITGRGVTIFNPNGEMIGHIDIPERWTANVTFGGRDWNTLFITAMDSLYAIQTSVRAAGH